MRTPERFAEALRDCLDLAVNSPADLADALSELISPENEGNACITEVRTYAEAGVLTSDAGLVIRFDDGREFQITIVRSR